MIQIRPIIYALGLMLCTVSAAMVLPAVVDIADGRNDWQVYLWSAFLTLFFGGLMVLVGHTDQPTKFGVRESFLLTTASWVTITAFAAVPFVGMGLSYTDAFFEAMSGLTATGATVLVGLDKLPRGILLWRMLLHTIGGLGIIVMAILMMPFLRVGGMQLFRTESSERSEKILPRVHQLVIATACVYFALITTCAIVYLALGMTAFDAICHAMSTMATAGFANYDESFGYFRSAPLEWACVVFMAIGGMPNVLFVRAFHGEPGALWRDAQVRGFVTVLVVVTLLMSIWLSATHDLDFFAALRRAAFSVTSIVTTTGLITEDYAAWGTFAAGVFFLLMFIGGCSGSTSGSIKIYRYQVAAMLTRSHLLHLISPSRVQTLSYNGRPLPPDVPFSVVAFLVVYMATVGVFMVILCALGLDLVTAASAAVTAVCNVGPGLGEIVGPAGNFTTMPTAAKWVLSLAMLMGRLELFTVLVLLRPEFWRG